MKKQFNVHMNLIKMVMSVSKMHQSIQHSVQPWHKNISLLKHATAEWPVWPSVRRVSAPSHQLKAPKSNQCSTTQLILHCFISPLQCVTARVTCVILYLVRACVRRVSLELTVMSACRGRLALTRWLAVRVWGEMTWTVTSRQDSAGKGRL